MRYPVRAVTILVVALALAPYAGQSTTRAPFTGSTAATMNLSSAADYGCSCPADVASLHAWYKADAITGIADGGALSAWPDSSGNGYVTEQPLNDNFRPTYQAGVVNSKPAVRFQPGGNDKVVRSGASASQSATTIFVVLKPASVAGLPTLRTGDNGTLLFRLNTGKLEVVKSGSAIVGTGSTTLTSGNWVVAAATYAAGNSWGLYLNGNAEGSGSTPHVTEAGTYSYLGASGIFGGNPFVGDMAEVVVYNSVLSNSDRNAVTRHLGMKYGITVA